MELKDYQVKTVEQIKRYLELLSEWKSKADENPELEIDYPEKAWEKAEIGRHYISRKNGIGEYLPNFCLKIPTGGGKTLLAVKTIDQINSLYLRKQTGLVLWIVPTTQIYTQTIRCFKDKNHPYRQMLDIASAGRTLILEKTDKFSPIDIQENLSIMMLMLPSANRVTKEVLKVFKDNGGFQSFFPTEDKISEHEKLLTKYPNLDFFGDLTGIWQRQIKTSLGNTLRLLSPLIILDEGHKAYSEGAQKTLRDFNPSIIVELSATPSDQSNKLVDIKGIELKREEMIKLDLHVINKVSLDWKNTLLASVNHQQILEKKANEYQANTGNYIRPICLIQVERTGKDQRDGRFIHSEDVKEHLIKTIGISPDQIAIKTSEKDELKEIDDLGGLMSKNTSIRYIITKHALQEGWDCPFAYILTILNNPQSENALTQLIGRILRQPFARKTGIDQLDESYVFTYQQQAVHILTKIKKGFENEGLGDLSSQITTDEGFENGFVSNQKTIVIREKFEKSVKEIFLPVFVVNDDQEWKLVNYEMDISKRVDWNDLNLDSIYSIHLSPENKKDTEHITTLVEDPDLVIKQKTKINLKEGVLKLDKVFLSRQLLDVISNPWQAYEVGNEVLLKLTQKHGSKLVLNNFNFIIEELRKLLINENDRLSKKIFLNLLNKQRLRFLIITNKIGYQLPKKKIISNQLKTLTQSDGTPLQQSLFDFVPKNDFNQAEKSVAWFLENQQKMFFWYRNAERSDYAIQGWRKQKIYPDFIFTTKDEKKEELSKIFVIETKGIHLKNEDTQYKQSILAICNQKAKEKNWGQLKFLKDKTIQFELIFTDEWQDKLNSLIN